MFGEELDWQRLDEKRASRISAYINKRIGFKDEDKLDKLQEELMEVMTRFEKALGRGRKLELWRLNVDCFGLTGERSMPVRTKEERSSQYIGALL